ncbi:MAG: hypothetical protein PHH75_01605 [Candidatus Omnitrophica bacterium]|nr:hypothetical protein [Candidatus Omnitrophota bacterium]MDD5573855.1 hypothetical protein [Candidatus Omnitrophota bacterium]
MNKIIFEIKNHVYETVILLIDFFKGINLFVTAGILLALYLVVFRKWLFGKILSFCITILLLLVFYVRINHFLLTELAQDATSFTVGVFRTLSVIVAGAILLYYAAVKQ